MLLRDHIRIQATVPQVWELLTDLEQFPAWLPKCSAVLKESDMPVQRGSRFCIERTWKQESRVGEVEIIDLQAPKRFAWREQIQDPKQPLIVEECFQLIPKGKYCVLKHSLNLKESGIPFPVRLLMTFIHYAGRPVGKTGLMKLKELAEQKRD